MSWSASAHFHTDCCGAPNGNLMETVSALSQDRKEDLEKQMVSQSRVEHFSEHDTSNLCALKTLDIKLMYPTGVNQLLTKSTANI